MATKPIFDDVPAWPDAPVRDGPAHRHDNDPPLEARIPIEFQQGLLGEHPDFMTLLDQLLGKTNADPAKPEDLGAVDRARCEDDTTLGLCGELVKRLRACEQLVDKVHRDVKAPYLLGSRLVDAEKNALAARIASGKQKVEALQQDYLREQRRREQEAAAARDAERRRLEELARENNIDITEVAPPPPPIARAEPIRSDGGATVSRLTEWKSQVEDYPKAFKHVKDDAKVREAIDAAIQRLVKSTKGQKALTGVRIFEDIKASNR